MSTKTKATALPTHPVIAAEAVKVLVVASVVALVRACSDASAKAEASFVSLALGVRAAAAKYGYDRAQAHTMVKLAYREAFEFKGTEEEAKQFDLDHLSYVSKVIGIAFPKEATALKEVDRIIAHNKTATNGDRIGVNKLIEASRDNVTYSEIIAHKRAKKDARSGKGSRTGTAPTYTVEMASSEMATIFSRTTKAKIDLDKLQSIFDKWMTDYREKESAGGK